MTSQNLQQSLSGKNSIIYRLIAELKPDPQNPRIHSKKQIRQIANSIKTFGFTVPILLDQFDNVVAGHGRLLACQQLGYTEVATISLNNLTPDQVKAYRIADNKLTDNSVWDDQLLAEQLSELSLLDLDFDIGVIGFDAAEIDIRIESLNADESDAADTVPEPTAYAVSQLDDLWLLGNHRLLHGNSLDPAAFELLMNKQLARAVFSDVPWNVRINGHVSGNGAIVHREFVMCSGEMTDDEFTAFLGKVFDLFIQHSMNGSVHYIVIDWRHASNVITSGAKYHKMLNMCVWVKDRPAMGSFYRSQHELIFVFRNGTASHLNNVQLGSYGRNRSNVWEYDGILTMRHRSGEPDLLALHPTCKPVQLVADAILDCTERKDIVVDSFLGSGTTLMAAERVGRYCYAMELDGLYIDTAIRRWQNYTGQQAVHAETGQAFAQYEAQAQQAIPATTKEASATTAKRKTSHD